MFLVYFFKKVITHLLVLNPLNLHEVSTSQQEFPQLRLHFDMNSETNDQ